MHTPDEELAVTPQVLRDNGKLKLIALIDHLSFDEGGYHVTLDRLWNFKVEGHPFYKGKPFLFYTDSLDDLNDLWDMLCSQFGGGFKPLTLLPPMKVEKVRI